MVPLADLEAAFSIWKRQRDHVLGFEPRVIVFDGDSDQTGHGSGLITHNSGEAPVNCRYKFKLSNGFYDVVVSYSVIRASLYH